MAGKNTAVFCIYRNRVEVETAVDTLRREGFRNTDISVLFPENEGTKDFAHEKNTKAPEGATTGAASGAVLGGGLDGLWASVRWQSPDWGLSSRRDPLWLPSQGLEPAVRLAV